MNALRFLTHDRFSIIEAFIFMSATRMLDDGFVFLSYTVVIIGFIASGALASAVRPFLRSKEGDEA